MKKNNVKQLAWGIDTQGNLRFAQRETPIGGMYLPDTIWDFTISAIIVMVVCCVMDFSVFFQLFKSFAHLDWWMQGVAVGACLVAFDVLPSLLARELKKDKIGMHSSKLIKILSIVSFIAVFLLNFWLRFATRNTLLPADTGAAGSAFADLTNAAASTNPAALPYCIFSCMMPVATSVFSFIVSYNSCHPIAKPLKQAYATKCAIEDAIDNTDAILAEYHAAEDYRDRLIAEDNRLYEEKMAAIENVGYLMADYVREQIAEHLGDAAATNYLSKNTHYLMRRNLEDVPALYELPKINDNSEFTKEAI